MNQILKRLRFITQYVEIKNNKVTLSKITSHKLSVLVNEFS